MDHMPVQNKGIIGEAIMDTNRQIRIGDDIIREYYWSGVYVVYINSNITKETYKEAIERLTPIVSPIKD